MIISLDNNRRNDTYTRTAAFIHALVMCDNIGKTNVMCGTLFEFELFMDSVNITKRDVT